MKQLGFFTRSAATVLAGLGIAAVSAPAQAQTVWVNSVQICSGGSPAPQMQVSSTGDVTIVCQAVGTTTGTPAAPSCLGQTTSIQVGGTATVSALCTGTNTTTTYAWTSVTGSAPPFTATNSVSVTNVGPFPAVGNYSYSLTATNTPGGSSTPTTAMVVVSATPPPPPLPTCSTASVNGNVPATYGQFSPTIPAGGFVSYSLPVYTSTGKAIYMSTVEGSGRDGQNVQVQFAVATCPGDFDPTKTALAECSKNQVVEAMVLPATTGTARTPTSICTLVTNTQYYLNVRNTYANGTNACGYASCSFVVTLNSN